MQEMIENTNTKSIEHVRQQRNTSVLFKKGE